MLYWLLRPWRSAFTFRGRSPRREYWLFLVQLALAFFVAAMTVTGIADSWAEPMSDFNLGLIIIGLFLVAVGLFAAASVRRLHDHDKTGWLYLLVLVPLVGWIFYLIMMLTPGTPGENSHGPDPRQRGRIGAEAAAIFR